MNTVAIVVLTIVAVTVGSLLDWRIVGGQNAAPGQFKHHISLRYNNRHNCGGSIISPDTILTAAHCVDGYSPKSLTVVVGSTKLDRGGETFAVKSTRTHPDWSPWAFPNDAAVVKLERNITYSDLVQPIEIEETFLDGGKPVTLSGWGRTSFPGEIPNDLQYINLLTTSLKECRNKHKPSTVADSEVCTLTKVGEGACHGDSGGALTHNGKQVGIVSWGRPCAVGWPDVYTRCSSFADWINAQKDQ